MTLGLALILALGAAPDAGAHDKPLTFADVRVGDFLEYQIDGKAKLKLRACAKSSKAVTVAISTQTGERSRE
jgi:hypothetical protein